MALFEQVNPDGSVNFTDIEQRFGAFFSRQLEYISANWSSVFVDALTGVDVGCANTRLQDMLLLFMYLELIYDRIQTDIVNSSELTVAEYRQEYCLKDISKRFMCHNIDITDVLADYGLSESMLTGIGYMSVEGELPEFEIF